MTIQKNATRRTFLQGGALLASPLAAVSLAAGSMRDERLHADVGRLQDEAAIRALHHDWLRQLNAGVRNAHLDPSVRRMTAHHDGAPDTFAIAADRATAIGRFDYTVESEVTLPPDSTLAQMAHAQGHGCIRRTDRSVLEVHYVRYNGTWSVARALRLPA